jgi:hypothetical protein
MYEGARALTEGEPEAPTELEQLRSEVRVLKAADAGFRERLKALESWPLFQEYQAQRAAAQAAAEASQREAERRAPPPTRRRISGLSPGLPCHPGCFSSARPGPHRVRSLGLRPVQPPQYWDTHTVHPARGLPAREPPERDQPLRVPRVRL